MRSPIVYCGPMWGGKTEALISRLVRARLMDIETLAFNPVRNDRYGTTDIVAHSGATIPARAVSITWQPTAHKSSVSMSSS